MLLKDYKKLPENKVYKITGTNILVRVFKDILSVKYTTKVTGFRAITESSVIYREFKYRKLEEADG